MKIFIVGFGELYHEQFCFLIAQLFEKFHQFDENVLFTLENFSFLCIFQNFTKNKYFHLGGANNKIKLVQIFEK